MNIKDIINKFDSGEELTEQEIKYIVKEGEEQLRHNDSYRNIFKVCNRYFRIECAEGYDYFSDIRSLYRYYYQPIEVKFNTYEKIIKVSEWIDFRSM